MKSAPFTILPVLYTTIISGAIIGGLIGALMSNSLIDPILIGTLCGFVPLAVGGWLRTIIVGMLASSKGLNEPVRYGFSLPIRLAIAFVIALIVAYITIGAMGVSVDFISGLLMGIASAIVMIVIMSVRMMTK